MRTQKDDSGSLAVTALKVVVGLFFVGALALIGVFGYAQLDEGPDTPEFEQTGELRYEATGDWENPGRYDGETYDRGDIESAVVEHTNEERRTEGLDPLESSDRHVEVARSHSADMANNGYVGHVDSDGRTFEERVEPRGCSSVGENAAATFYEVAVRNARTNETEMNTNPEEVADMLVDDWMASPTHRENILGEYDAVSVGVYVSEGNTVFATQVFCNE
ncbi:MAG: CAP domain-containing protein [Halobacteriales archaeon]